MSASWGRVPVAAAGEVQLGSRALRTLVAITSFANAKCECWPSLEKIVDLTGIDRHALHKEISSLVEAGLLRVTHRWRPDGGRTANLYTIVMEPHVPLAAGAASHPPQGPASHLPQQREPR